MSIKIIAGQFRGRSIEVADSDKLRPTSNRVREAVFSMLQSRISLHDAAIADLCCGTGAYGIEAISRGANKAWFIDHHKQHLDLARQNLHRFAVEVDAQFIQRDASKHLPSVSQPLDVIFIDPPYDTTIAPQILAALLKECWLHGETIIVLEQRKGKECVIPDSYELLRQKNYGIASVMLLRPASL